MNSVTSQVAQFGDLPNYKSKLTSSDVLCAVCGDVLSSVLSYHNHNVTKHTSHELSLVIIKLCGLQFEQIFRINDYNQAYSVKESSPKQATVSNGMITHTNFECDSLFHKKKLQLRNEAVTSKATEATQEEKRYRSREEIRQEKELINNVSNTLQNQNEKEHGKQGKQKEQIEDNFKVDEETENREEDITCISSVNQNQKDYITSNNNGIGVTEANYVQCTNNKYLIENEKYKINEKESLRVRIKKRKSISKNVNEDNDLYECNGLYECNDLFECNEVVPSKGVKLEEEILTGMNDNETTNNEESNHDLSTNFGLNVCDSLVAEEVFLQPHNYTEETIPHLSQTYHTLQPSIQKENNFQVHSNNTFTKYEHSQVMHQSENDSQQKLLSYQAKNVEGQTTLKQGYTDHSEKPLEGIFNQESFDTNPFSRYNEVENVLRNNTNNSHNFIQTPNGLENDLIYAESDLKGMVQNTPAKNTIVNTQHLGILKPERKKYKSEDSDTKDQSLIDSQIDLLMKKSYVSDLENSDEWEIDYIEVKTEPFSWCKEGDYSHQNLVYEDIECNDYIYNENIYDINTESSNFSSESNESTYENETNIGLDNDKEKEISGNTIQPNEFHGINYASVEESLQQSIDQIISCEEKDSNKDKKLSKMETKDNFHTNKKRRKKKQSPIKSNEWLPRNRTKHRMNEKMRRMELNQQFDHLLKRLPDYGQGRSLPKHEILNRARKYVSKLENVNNKLLKTKESLEEYQQKLINSLSKSV